LKHVDTLRNDALKKGTATNKKKLCNTVQSSQQ